MNPAIFVTILNAAKSINYVQLVKTVSKYAPYAIKAKNIYNNLAKEKEEASEEGQTSRQFYYSKIKNVANGVLENIDLENYIKSHFENIASNIKETLGDKIGIEDVDEFIELYREFLDGNDEKIEELVPYIQAIIDEIFKDDKLREKIGEELFNVLTALVINFGLKINKTTYQLAIEKINSEEFKSKIRDFYENYIISIADFIKKNKKAKENAEDVANFATGEKATSIIGIIGKVTNFVANKNTKLNTIKENIFEKAKSLFERVKNLNPLKMFKKEKNYENY